MLGHTVTYQDTFIAPTYLHSAIYLR